MKTKAPDGARRTAPTSHPDRTGLNKALTKEGNDANAALLNSGEVQGAKAEARREDLHATSDPDPEID